MQKVKDMEPKKLKFIAFVASLVTLGLAVFFIIRWGFFGEILKYMIFAGVTLALTIVPEEKKKIIVENKIVSIICYVFFLAWCVWFAIDLIRYILAGLPAFDIFNFALMISYGVSGLAGLVYYHIYKISESNGDGDNKQPLLNNA